MLCLNVAASRSLCKDEFLSSDTPPTCYNAYCSTMNLLIVYIPVSDCHTIMVMMFIYESVCSRVLDIATFLASMSFLAVTF